MGLSDRWFNRQTTLYQVLGGGIAADVILWRSKNLSAWILAVTSAAWWVFERSSYTLISFVSSVFFLLFTILFLWAKSAAILNRPPPPLPHLHVSEEMVQEAATSVGKWINNVLSMFEDIALGKDSRMFANVALSLLLLSVVGGLVDFFSLIYITIAIVLTIPVLYEKYEDELGRYSLLVLEKLKMLHNQFDREFISNTKSWIIEKKKLS